MTQRPFLRDRSDWLLVLAIVMLLPLVAVFCVDFWMRTDFRFFPLLIVAGGALPLWLGTWNAARRKQHISAGVLWCASGISGACASLMFSPWLAMCALALAWLAWMLMRLGGTPWTQLVSWVLPLGALLLLPVSDQGDRLHSFTQSITESSSSLLDLLSVPQMPQQQALGLRMGRLDVTPLCLGLGNPYLLFSLTALMCAVTRFSFLVSCLTLLSAPLWAWGSSVVLLVTGVLVAEKFEIYLLVGMRLWICQGVLLLVALTVIYAFGLALRSLLSPFVAYSEGIAFWHKFYNAIVLWPAPDPLRSRKNRATSNAAAPTLADSKQLPFEKISALIAACLFVLTGGASVYLGSSRSAGLPELRVLLTHPELASDMVENQLVATELPSELAGMKLIDYAATPTPGTATRNSLTARWTYAYRSMTIQISAATPYRGYYELDRDLQRDGAQIVEPRRPFDLVADAESPQLVCSDLVLLDPLFGASYLANAMWTSDGSRAPQATATNDSLWLRLAYQPSTFSASLMVEGVTPATDETRREFQAILREAVSYLGEQSALRQAALP